MAEGSQSPGDQAISDALVHDVATALLGGEAALSVARSLSRRVSVDEAVALRFVEGVSEGIRRFRESARGRQALRHAALKRVAKGVLYLLIGVFGTMGSYAGAGVSGRFTVFYGAVIAGFYLIVRGGFDWSGNLAQLGDEEELQQNARTAVADIKIGSALGDANSSPTPSPAEPATPSRRAPKPVAAPPPPPKPPKPKNKEALDTFIDFYAMVFILDLGLTAVTHTTVLFLPGTARDILLMFQSSSRGSAAASVLILVLVGLRHLKPLIAPLAVYHLGFHSLIAILDRAFPGTLVITYPTVLALPTRSVLAISSAGAIAGTVGGIAWLILAGYITDPRNGPPKRPRIVRPEARAIPRTSEDQ